MENLNDMFDLNNLIGRLRRIENDPAAQFEDIEDAFNDMIGQPIVAPIITMPAGILVLRARQVKSFNEVQSEEQISYLPQQLCEKFGRANMPDKFTDNVNADREYWIPAKFTFDVLVQPIIDGIFYESSQGRVDDRLKDCISVALKPQSVDTKLHFLGVYDVLIKNDGEKVTISAPIFRNL